MKCFLQNAQLWLCLLLLSFNGLAQQSRETVLFNDHWKFHLGEVDQAEDVNHQDTAWRELQLPHDWSVEAPLSPSLASANGYLPGGIGWYRKTFPVSEDKKGRQLYIYFGGIYNNSEVYLNGQLLGKRPNGYVSFSYDLTPYIKYGADNVIAVKVDHRKYNDSRWYTGSGIFRDVVLSYTHPVHIDLWGIGYETKLVKGNSANLAIATKIRNTGTEKATLTVMQEIKERDSEKLIVKKQGKTTVNGGETTELALDVTVPAAKLWSVAEPNLYTLRTTVQLDGKTIDEESTAIGIRTTTFDADKGFALNGEWMKMKGVCIHHDAGVLGAAVPREVWERRLKQLKALGCNAIRMSHNPQATDVYDLCDELGLLVMDEAFDEWRKPKRKWVEGWNVGTPSYDGYAEYFDEWGERDLRDMVLRDKRHPSIVMWSIGNEVDYPNDPYTHPILDSAQIGQKVFGGFQPERPHAEELGEIAKRLVKVVKIHDPSRPVTAALAGVVMSNFTDYPGVVDVAGYNYTEDRYEQDHKAYPERIIYGSENRHDIAAWEAVRDNEYIFGQFLWTGIDYLGESGRWPSRGFYSGLMDLGGFVKPRGYFRQSLWASAPMAYIGTYPLDGDRKSLSMDAWPVWNYREGDSIRVVCYTNCSQAQLLLNGRAIGEVKAYDDASGIISWDIPYQAGKLEVIGLEGGQERARYTIHTSGRPFQLKASVDKTVFDKEKRDVAHITVEIMDENGLPVTLADDNIHCRMVGPAKLLGMEASNNTDMGDYRDNQQRAYRGRLLAYVQPTGEQGEVQIEFSSPWLKPVTVKLEVK
ncbi:glycoside hydrolase family 2 protein [Olivibacter sp. SDN3]|uniref:sugar-binding domain-containing protein n=1 Tax=Olivibacter sp. SDN3 TaxID=2764720 RepID=UPI00165177AE|nr:sugar-binding domain-containing protein [Olivibacter sp. SDN3]QNL47987.1 glycoside hydrolase family 2 protein [Olivibacter sp. SDN3]